MITVLDLKAEFSRLTMLKGRTPTSSEAEREGAFARLAPAGARRPSRTDVRPTIPLFDQNSRAAPGRVEG